VERELLSKFGGGCHLPLGAHCVAAANTFTLRALVASPTGDERIESLHSGPDADALVAKVHDDLLRQGAAKYL
jgi:porphobilinogen deaminase